MDNNLTITWVWQRSPWCPTTQILCARSFLSPQLSCPTRTRLKSSSVTDPPSTDATSRPRTDYSSTNPICTRTQQMVAFLPRASNGPTRTRSCPEYHCYSTEPQKAKVVLCLKGTPTSAFEGPFLWMLPTDYISLFEMSQSCCTPDGLPPANHRTDNKSNKRKEFEKARRSSKSLNGGQITQNKHDRAISRTWEIQNCPCKAVSVHHHDEDEVTQPQIDTFKLHSG